MTRHLKPSLAAGLVAALTFLGAPLASAQKATAVPRLDLDKLTGTWYQIAKLPVKSEKKCLSDNTVLYALNDKANSFQYATFCTVKHGEEDDISNSGRQGKTPDGKLQTRHWIFLHRPYWVLATAPDFTWALVGTPDHKSLWILSRNVDLQPETLNQLKDTAAAQGYPVAKLVPVTHPKERVTLASPSANPNQIETPSPTPTKTPAQPSAPAGKQ